MIEFLHTIALCLIVATVISVCYDITTHSRRQAEWERAHSGDIYIPQYRKYQRNGKP